MVHIETIETTQHKTKLYIKDTSVPFINCLRRICSSLTPTVTFDDKYHVDKTLNSINIVKNTSALHNEFLSHRLSLIPINMDNGKNLKIKTKYNITDNKRDWTFVKDPPVFNLNIKNSFDGANEKAILDVTTNDFKVELVGISEDEEEIDIKDYFPADPYTGEHILINKLKSHLTNREENEELEIICLPRIGMGYKNARNDPTGTVTYEFMRDEPHIIESYFEKKLQNLQEERKSKDLNEYNEAEQLKIRNSFNLLDIERVYRKNQKGEANEFIFTIESIGFMKSEQIIIDSIQCFILKLTDLKNSFTFENLNGNMNLNILGNIEVETISEKNEKILIHVSDENHTLGNILKYHLVNNFVSSDPNTDDIMTKPLIIGGYCMPHPTIEALDFKFVLRENITKNMIIDYIYSQNHVADIKSIPKEKYSELKINKLKIMFISLLFIKTINNTINEFKEFLGTYTSEKSITVNEVPLFSINDDIHYFDKNLNYT